MQIHLGFEAGFMSSHAIGHPLVCNQHSFSEGWNDGWAGRDAAFPEWGDYMRGWQKGHTGLLRSQIKEQEFRVADNFQNTASTSLLGNSIHRPIVQTSTTTP